MAGARCFQSSRTTTRRRRPSLLAQQPPWPVVLLLLALLVLVLAPSCCQATRGMQPFRGKPLEPGSANHFLGFLPRGPVTPSGPSRQHNSIGAQDQSHP